MSWLRRNIFPGAVASRNVVISLVMSLTLNLSNLLDITNLFYLIYLTLFFKILYALTHWLAFTLTAKLSWTNKQLMSEQWWQNCVQEKSSNLFLGHFVAGRPGRKQEASVVVVGMGGEQKNWSRLEGKWVWWVLPPISQIPTDHKQIHLLALKLVVLFRERLSKAVACWVKAKRVWTDLRVDPQLELKSWSQTSK